jgi:hypothetical protein
MSTTLKAPKGLKNSECKKGQLSNRPPIPYVAETNIVSSKEKPQVLKVRLLDDSHLNMLIFSRRNTKEYLAHIVAVLHIIKQKGLDAKCRKLGMAVVRQSKTLKNLLKAAGSKDTISLDVEVVARKVEIEQTQQILQEAQKTHNELIAKTYEHLRNLLSGNFQSQWDCVCRKMHESDSWAGVNGQVTKGRHPCTWISFQDCLELHKLTVFSADAAKRQQFYIQQAVRKPQRVTVQQPVSQMGVSNDYVRYLPTLKDSPKAVPTTKKRNIPFGKADLAAIMLASVLASWQNQYNLNHSTVPELTRTLLLDLEAIEHIMDENQSKKLKAKGKASTARPEAKSSPEHKASGGPTGQVPKMGRSEKFCQHCKAHGGPYKTHNILDCHCYDSNRKPLKAAAGKPSESKKPYKNIGGNKNMAFMQTMFKAYVKNQKKAESKKRKKHDYGSSDSSDSE